MSLSLDNLFVSTINNLPPGTGSSAGLNLLDNGNFAIWQRGTTSVSCATSTRTFRADRWAVNPAGAAVTQIQDTNTPDTNSLYSLKVIGATSTTTVLISQRMEAAVSAFALKSVLVFSAYIYNGTGGAFTPSLLVGTPGALNTFTTVTNKLTQTLPSCPDATWTRVTYSFDPSAYANIANGAQLDIQIPSGSLDSTGKHVKISQVQLEKGTSFSSFYLYHSSVETRICSRFYQVLAGSYFGIQNHAEGVLSVEFPVIMVRAPDNPNLLAGNCTFVGWAQYSDDTSGINSVGWVTIINGGGGILYLACQTNNLQGARGTSAGGFVIGTNAEL